MLADPPPDTPDILARIVSGVSDDFPVQPATRLPDWSAGGSLRCLSVRVSCRSEKSSIPTRTTCCGHPREDVTRMLRRNRFRGTSALCAAPNARTLARWRGECVVGTLQLPLCPRCGRVSIHRRRPISSSHTFDVLIRVHAGGGGGISDTATTTVDSKRPSSG